MVALFGAGLAWFFYMKRPELPGQIAERIGGLYRIVSHKYYVDEGYNLALIAPIIDISRRWLWHGVDQNGIDSVINDSAASTGDLGGVVQEMQSGNLRSYAGWMTLGAAAVVAYMVWQGVH